jgi:uncharacterized repeat protein (TIGR02543 family)
VFAFLVVTLTLLGAVFMPSTARAANTQVAVAQIRSESATGTVVRDLLDADDHTPITPGGNYYLYVEVKNPAASGQTGFVSLEFGLDGQANGVTFFNPPGSTFTPGAITHDSLATLQSYVDDANPTYGNPSSPYQLVDGKAVWTIKSSFAQASTVSFACGLVLDTAFYGDQTDLSKAITISCGTIEDGNLSTTSEVTSDVYATPSRSLMSLFDGSYTVSMDGSVTIVPQIRNVSGITSPFLYDTLEYDLTLPAGVTVEDYGLSTKFAKTSGVYGDISISTDPTMSPDGSTATYHVTLSHGYKLAASTLSVYVKLGFPRATFSRERVYSNLSVTNVSITQMSPNPADLTATDTTGKVTVVDPDLDKTTMVAVNRSESYNWTIEQGSDSDYATQMGSVNITNPSAEEGIHDKTYDAHFNTTGTAAAITLVTLPKGTNSSPTISYEGIDLSGNAVSGTIPLANNITSSSSKYYLFRASDLGLSAFTRVTYDMGRLTGSCRTNNWTSSYAYEYNTSGAWGHYTTDEPGIQVKSTYRLYNTDPTLRDLDAGNLSVETTCTSSSTAKAGFDDLATYSNIKDASGTSSTTSVTAGGSVTIKDAQLSVYSVPEASYSNDTGKTIKGDTSLISDPVLYITLPKGMTYSDLSFSKLTRTPNGTWSKVDDVAFSVENVSYLNTTGDGASIYKVTLDGIKTLGYYDADGNLVMVDYTVRLNTARYLETKLYALNDLFHLTSSTNVLALPYTGKNTSGITTRVSEDTYDLNGGNPIADATRSSKPEYGFGVQQLSEIVVSNSITVSTINDQPVDERWYTYDETDPNSVALLGLKSSGTYRVTLHNPSVASDVDLRMFVPIPKKGQDLGTAFMDGEQTFDMNLTFDASTLPEGFTATYVKVSGSYTSVEADNVTYEECDASQANAILVTYVGTFEGNSSKQLDLSFVTEGTVADLGKLNIWRDAYYYKTSDVESDKSLYGEYVASETAGGTVSGTAFHDHDTNGMQDDGDEPVSGVTVVLKDSHGKTYSTTTDEDGRYDFPAVREDTVSLTMTTDSSSSVRFNIDPITSVPGKVCSTVTPSPNGLSAAETFEVSSDGDVVNAALGDFYQVKYDGNDSTSGVVPTTREYASGATATVSVKPDNLARSGYAFTGWNTAADGSGTAYQAGQTFEVSSDVTLYAQWKCATYTVTFDYQGATSGKDVTSKEVTYHSAYGELPSPTRTGYTFRGWSTSRDGFWQVTPTSRCNLTSNSTIYAWWTEKGGYTVAYDAAGGTQVDDATVKWTDTVLPATKPTRTGYDLVGWTHDGTTVTAAATYGDLAGDDATASITLTAVWAAKGGYTVTYDTDGGSTVADLEDVSWTQTGLLPATNPTRAQHAFTGWVDANGDPVDGSVAYSALATDDATTSITLTATWTATSDHTVHYDTQGGSSVADKTGVAASDAGLIPATAPTLAGSTFVGWNTQADGQGTAVDQSTVYSTLTDADELTLHAIWTTKAYAVKYVPGNGSTIADLGCTWKATGLTPADDPTRSGHTFAGWYLSGTDTKVTSTTAYSSLASDDSVASVTLVARWTTKGGYTVVFDAAGGTADPMQVTNLSWTSAGLTDKATVTRTGYTFAGWTHGGTAVSSTDTYGALAGDDATTSITLTATWTPKGGYTVRYETAGGSAVADRTNVSWDDSSLASPVVPTKAGYTFDHWTCGRTTVDASTAYGDLATTDETGSHITLVANYVDRTDYSVSYDSHGGSAVPDKTGVGWNSTQLVPSTNPTWEGHTFTGWTYGSDPVTSNSRYSTLVGGMETPSIKLDATWRTNSYSISFNANGGTGSMAVQTLSFGESASLTPNAFTKAKYRFVGWATTPGGGVAHADQETVSDLSATDGDVVRLYAVWAERTPIAIEVETAPNKTVYESNERLDPTGLVVKVTYDNGETEDVSYADAKTRFVLSPSVTELLAPEDTSFTIELSGIDGLSTEQAITVKRDAVILFIAGHGGSCSPTAEALKPLTGHSIASVATADEGYDFIRWTCDDTTFESTDATLTTDQIDAIAKQSGEYVTATFRAVFAPALSVTVSPTSATVTSGDHVELTATTAGGTGTKTYQWQANTGTADEPIWTVIDGVTDATLDVAPLKTCSLRVVATDENGISATSDATTVEVLQKATANVTLDGQDWTDCDKHLSAHDARGDAHDLTQEGSRFTAALSEGTYDLFDDDGKVGTLVVSAAGGNAATVEYLTLTITVSSRPTAAYGGTLDVAKAADAGVAHSETCHLAKGTSWHMSASPSEGSRVGAYSDSADTSITAAQAKAGYSITMDAARTLAVTFEAVPSVPLMAASDVETTVGADATLVATKRAGYEPVGTLSYQWQVNTGTAWTNVDGATDASFLVPTDQAGDTAYRCRVTDSWNPDGTSVGYATATVKVNDALGVSVSGATTVVTGNGTTLTATTTGGTGEKTFQWYLNTGTSASPVWEAIPGATSATYTTAALTETTGFRLVATDSAHATAEAMVQVTVNDHLGVSISPSSTTVAHGDEVTLTATPSGGIGPFSYVWTRDGEVIGTAARLSVSPEESGTYSVLVTDQGGAESASANAYVDVTYAAEVHVTLDGDAWGGQGLALSLTDGTTTVPLDETTGGTYACDGLVKGTWTVMHDGVSTGRTLQVGPKDPTGSASLPFFTVTVTVTEDGGTGSVTLDDDECLGTDHAIVMGGSTHTVVATPADDSSLTVFSDSNDPERGTVDALDGYTTKTIVAPTSIDATFALTPVAPVVRPPSDQTVEAGADASFSVEVSQGIGEVTFAWQVSEDGGTTWTDVAGATASTLTLDAVTQDMDGWMYRCVVTDSHGPVTTTSDPATLTVSSPEPPAPGPDPTPTPTPTPEPSPSPAPGSDQGADGSGEAAAVVPQTGDADDTTTLVAMALGVACLIGSIATSTAARRNA